MQGEVNPVLEDCVIITRPIPFDRLVLFRQIDLEPPEEDPADLGG